MKILMFGRGVISTQYAWAFEKAGHTVEFYVRKGRKTEWGPTVSLNIYDARKSIFGKLIEEVWPVKLIEDIGKENDHDLIIVSVQHYQFKKAIESLIGKIGSATVLICNNFWEEPLEQIAGLPSGQIVWGFPFAGGGFDNKGILNGALFGNFTIGTFGTELTERAAAVIDLFKSAGIKSTVSKDFRSWLFGHFVIGAAMCLESLKVGEDKNYLKSLKTTEFWENVIADGKELLPLLKLRNVDMAASSDLKLLGMPPYLLSFVMKIAKYVPSVKRQITGHSNIEEKKSYSRDVMKTAEILKVRLPRFEQYKNIFA